MSNLSEAREDSGHKNNGIAIMQGATRKRHAAEFKPQAVSLAGLGLKWPQSELGACDFVRNHPRHAFPLRRLVRGGEAVSPKPVIPPVQSKSNPLFAYFYVRRVCASPVNDVSKHITFRRRSICICAIAMLVLAAALSYRLYQIYPHSWLPFDQSHTFSGPHDAQITLRCMLSVADDFEREYVFHFRRTRVFQNGPGPSWSTSGHGVSPTTGRVTTYYMSLYSHPTPSGVELEIEWFADDDMPAHLHERFAIPVDQNLRVQKGNVRLAAAWTRT